MSSPFRKVVRIDFETRSTVDLIAAGAWKYASHPTTDVLCYAIKINDDPVEGFFIPNFLKLYGLEVNSKPWWLYDVDAIEAHNAGFEFVVWEKILTPRYGWPEPNPDWFFCSAAKAAVHGLPRSLDGAAKAMGLIEQKDAEGHAVMLKLSKPRPAWKKNKTGPMYFNDPDDFKKLLRYCKQDVVTEYELSRRLSPLNRSERKTYLLDQKINRRGVHFDRKLVKNAIELDKLEAKKGNQTLALLTDGAIQTVGQTEAIRKYLYNNFEFVLPNLRAETVDTVLKDDIPREVKQILKIRQKHAKSSIKKYKAMLARANSDDRIRETLLYHGAHTGRWTGIKIQPQNYPRPSLSRVEIENLLLPAIYERKPLLLELYSGTVSTALSDSLRSALIAAPGYDLIGADYSQIEARVLCWLAGEKWALKMFADDVDIYIHMASSIYGIQFDKLLQMYEERRPEAKEMRNVGKSTVLGCGYQMGDARFERECENRGIILAPGMATQIIDTYRDRFKRVKKLWYNINKTAIRALSGRATTTVGIPITFSIQGSFLLMRLPSGRFLYYKDPEIRINQFGKKALSYMHVDPKTKKWMRTTTYGGALTENAVQASARDIMCEAMHRAEAKNYPIVMNVHDELVAEVRKGYGSIVEFVKILCDVESWARGCPIKAEGWRGKRVRK